MRRTVKLVVIHLMERRPFSVDNSNCPSFVRNPQRDSLLPPGGERRHSDESSFCGPAQRGRVTELATSPP